MPEDRTVLRAVAEWIAGFDDKPETEDVDFAGALVRFVNDQRREARDIAVRACAKEVKGYTQGYRNRDIRQAEDAIRCAFPDSFKKVRKGQSS